MPLVMQPVPAGTTDPFGPDDVIEIGLLLPKNRAVELLALAKQRQETIGQVLRSLIDNAVRSNG